MPCLSIDKVAVYVVYYVLYACDCVEVNKYWYMLVWYSWKLRFLSFQNRRKRFHIICSNVKYFSTVRFIQQSYPEK